MYIYKDDADTNAGLVLTLATLSHPYHIILPHLHSVHMP